MDYTAELELQEIIHGGSVRSSTKSMDPQPEHLVNMF